jgi:ribonucleotide reductase beta subunit family protein with ferritin-like domain
MFHNGRSLPPEDQQETIMMTPKEALIFLVGHPTFNWAGTHASMSESYGITKHILRDHRIELMGPP